MNIRGLVTSMVLATLPLGVMAQAKPEAKTKAPLKLVTSIPLPGLKEGDFDHFTPDVEGHRLFLTGEENGKLFVFDTNTNKLIHTIADLKAPHAVLYQKDLNKLFIVDGDESAVKIYDGQSYQLLGKVELLADADSIAFDPKTNSMYVVNGGREAKTPYSLISVIDVTSGKKTREIKVDNNHVEAVVLEKGGSRLFCNITGANTVGVTDRTASSLTSEWKLPEGVEQNVAMQLDEKGHRLFVVTRKPGKLIVLDSDSGKVVTSLPAVGMVDDMSYDPDHQRLYLAGDQFLDIFAQKDADHYSLLARMPGGFRAKTGILVPDLHRYYLAIPHHGATQAKVNVYEVQN